MILDECAPKVVSPVNLASQKLDGFFDSIVSLGAYAAVS